MITFPDYNHIETFPCERNVCLLKYRTGGCGSGPCGCGRG